MNIVSIQVNKQMNINKKHMIKRVVDCFGFLNSGVILFTWNSAMMSQGLSKLEANTELPAQNEFSFGAFAEVQSICTE